MEKENTGLAVLLDKIQTDIKKLYWVATHDEKTGLHNHIFFKEVFELELEKARRGKRLSLIVADIDFFKKINDTYGHIQADEVLKRMARVLEGSVRKYDIVARFGGEEFFVMLPNTEILKAKKIGERLRRAVMNDSFLKKFSTTVSIGVAEFKKRDTFARIAKRADKGLYAAKKAGRNCVRAVK